MDTAFKKDTAGCAMGMAIFAKGYTKSIDTAGCAMFFIDHRFHRLAQIKSQRL